MVAQEFCWVFFVLDVQTLGLFPTITPIARSFDINHTFLWFLHHVQFTCLEGKKKHLFSIDSSKMIGNLINRPF